MAEQLPEIKDHLDEDDEKSEFYITKTVTLYSKEVKTLYRRCFDHTQIQASAAIHVPSKFQLHDLAKKNREEIEGTFAKVKEDLQTQTIYIDNIWSDAGLTDDDIATTDNAKTVNAKITSQLGTELLNILRQLDSLIVKMKTLNFHGELSIENSEDRATNWKNRMLRISEAIRILGTKAYTAAGERKKESAQNVARRREKTQAKRQARKTVKPNPDVPVVKEKPAEKGSDEKK